MTIVLQIKVLNVLLPTTSSASLIFKSIFACSGKAMKSSNLYIFLHSLVQESKLKLPGFVCHLLELETYVHILRSTFAQRYTYGCVQSEMCFCLNQVGEGEKLVKALFALARELQPAIIFLGQPACDLQCTSMLLVLNTVEILLKKCP